MTEERNEVLSKETTMNATNTLSAKFQNLEADLRTVLLERNEETHTAMLALIGRQHHFTLGQPGIGKSLLVDQLVKRIADVNYFDILLMKHSQPDEVFGGPDVKKLSETGAFERVITGMLPEADIAMLDEIFKANAAILNAMLRAMNERRFSMGAGRVIDIPLHTIFAASNELADTEELAAMWDRLHFRHFSNPLQETSNFVKMISSDIPDDPEHFLTMLDIKAARRAANEVEIPDEVLEATVLLKDQLLQESIEVSDRRWREAMKAIRSEAFYNGHSVAEIHDMRPLMHFLWSNPDHIKTVRRLVLELANPLEREAAELLDDLTESYAQYENQFKDAENKQQKAAHGVEMFRKLNKAKDSYKDLRKRQGKTGRQSDVMDELGAKIQSSGKQLLKALGHDDDDNEV
jgi:MoxR-like ATPase